ncbi:MAG: hypothetical protein LGB07_00825 [Sulfurovum sp.]|nr:hypothetical protein [Sulfurovum sp.]MCB4744190.1 hypothetical protein [Sulfurovum sp.]MCB4746405.1 hypothetical protein [Sulfurovum sp.]MCB4747852.1 hypothetical protein [Sulfurovum sp.]MCB4749192.1 hypothetical protein [Sulfurovum sp.]
MTRQYVWMMVLLVTTIGMGATVNPFELNENFQKLQQDQDTFLKEFKNSSKKLRAIQKIKDSIKDSKGFPEKMLTAETPIKPENISNKNEIPEKVVGTKEEPTKIDINITREKIEKAKRADEEFKKAIQEVS